MKSSNQYERKVGNKIHADVECVEKHVKVFCDIEDMEWDKSYNFEEAGRNRRAW